MRIAVDLMVDYSVDRLGFRDASTQPASSKRTYLLLRFFNFTGCIAEHAAILIKGCKVAVNEEEFFRNWLDLELFV